MRGWWEWCKDELNEAMSYNTGMLNKRVEVLRRCRREAGQRGRGSQEATFEVAGSRWASVTWTKGARALQEGALEAYDVVMIRMRWNTLVDKDCRIRCEGKVYQVLQLNDDKKENQVQILAQEVVGDTVVVTVPPYSVGELGEAVTGRL